MTFTIPGRLPSLNRTLKIGRWRFSQAFKRRKAKNLVVGWVRYAQLPRYQEPVQIRIRWVEKDRRRDYDNITAGTKFILDALVLTGRIPGDSQKWVAPVAHEFAYDKNNPRVEVTIAEQSESLIDNLVERARLIGAL